MKRIIKAVDDCYRKTNDCGVCVSLKVWKYRSGHAEIKWDLAIVPDGEVDLTYFKSFAELEKSIKEMV